MVSGSIARRWARALFAIGQEHSNLPGLLREVQTAADVWMSSEELRDAMTNPLIDRKARIAVWDSLIRRIGATRMGKNFLLLLFDKTRLTELAGIARELQVLSDNKDNRIRAEVIGAVPVSEGVVAGLRSALVRGTGKAVMISTSEDPSIIGGVITRVGNLMYDGSIRTRLSRMKEGMLGRSS